MPRKSSKSRRSKIVDPSDPIYIPLKQAGWNPKSGRYTGLDGRITTRDKVLQDNSPQEAFGNVVAKPFYTTPITNTFGQFEVVSSNLTDGKVPDGPYAGLQNVLKAALELATDPEKKRPANYMLPQVQTRMRLAEHFYQTEGDATNVCDVPIELISRKLIVDCSDTALRDDIEEFIAENNIEDTVGELWRTMRVYGQAFPYEVWKDAGKDLEAVVNMYPMHMHVGYNWYYLGAEIVGESKWSSDLIESRLPPVLHRPLLRHWNENPPPQSVKLDYGLGMPLDGKVLKPIRDKDFNWTRYSMPMLSRGFRDLTSRIVHEDAIRAVTEGYRYQLWVFTLGDADHMPNPNALKSLNNMLNGLNTERTGMLVFWDMPFKVNVYAPQGLDVLMGGNYLTYLTKQFFRKMGITAEVVSGEMPGMLGGATGGARSGAGELDVQIYIERCRFQADQVTNWVEYIVKKWAKANTKAVKPLKRLTVRFAPTVSEMTQRVAKIFMPMYEAGSLSLRTLHSTVGLTYESELANREAESKHGDLWMPPATYRQIAQSPSGVTDTSQTMPKGSPDNLGELRNRMTKPTRVESSEEYQPVSVTPVVHVYVPEQRVPVVNVPESLAPVVNIQSPKVEVNPTPIQVDVHVPESPAPIVKNTIRVPKQEAPVVNVPRQPAPVVNVESAKVEIQPVPVNVDFHVQDLPAPTVTVNMPEAQPPVVNVSAPNVEVNVPTPSVTVEAAQIHVAQPAPVVNISTPEVPAPVVTVTPTVTVQAPDVHVELPDQSDTIEEIEVVERAVDGSLQRARKTTTRHKRGSA